MYDQVGKNEVLNLPKMARRLIGMAVLFFVGSLAAMQSTASAGDLCPSGHSRNYLEAIAKMPAVKKVPLSGDLPFSPKGLFLGGPEGSLFAGGERVGFVLNSYGRNSYTLNWQVNVNVSRISSSGTLLKRIASKRMRLSRSRSYSKDPLSLGVNLPHGAAYYRFDIAIEDLAGHRLGHYAEYIRVLPARPRAKLAIGTASIQPGGLVGFRVENPGTSALTYGASIRIERPTPSGWVEVPGLPEYWPAWGIILLPGGVAECELVRLPPEVKAGSYRLSKPVTLERSQAIIRSSFNVD